MLLRALMTMRTDNGVGMFEMKNIHVQAKVFFYVIIITLVWQYNLAIIEQKK